MGGGHRVSIELSLSLSLPVVSLLAISVFKEMVMFVICFAPLASFIRSSVGLPALRDLDPFLLSGVGGSPAWCLMAKDPGR